MNATTTNECSCIGTDRWHECCGKERAAALGLGDVFAEALEASRHRFDRRDEHRVGCERRKDLRACEECQLWPCDECKALTDNPRVDIDGKQRPPLCDSCVKVFERRKLLATALDSFPSAKFYRDLNPENVESRELMAKFPGHAARRQTLINLATNRQSALFSGPRGAGKTASAIYVLRYVYERGLKRTASRQEIVDARDCRYLPASKLALARKQTKLGFGDEAPLVTAAIATSFLVIDDLGREDAGGLQTIKDVISERYDAGKPTWCTTSLEAGDKPAFANLYDGGTERRLIEGNGMRPIDFGGAA